MGAGVAYFGSRIPRHVAADMQGLAAYRETMARIVADSHACGLEVQIAPWGVC
jgi:hypothetical protein